MYIKDIKNKLKTFGINEVFNGGEPFIDMYSHIVHNLTHFAGDATDFTNKEVLEKFISYLEKNNIKFKNGVVGIEEDFFDKSDEEMPTIDVLCQSEILEGHFNNCVVNLLNETCIQDGVFDEVWVQGSFMTKKDFKEQLVKDNNTKAISIFGGDIDTLMIIDDGFYNIKGGKYGLVNFARYCVWLDSIEESMKENPDTYLYFAKNLNKVQNIAIEDKLINKKEYTEMCKKNIEGFKPVNKNLKI